MMKWNEIDEDGLLDTALTYRFKGTKRAFIRFSLQGIIIMYNYIVKEVDHGSLHTYWSYGNIYNRSCCFLLKRKDE